MESRRPSGSKTTDAFFPQVSNLALHRPEICQGLSLIPLCRLDQGAQIGRELFGFLRGERLRYGFFQRRTQRIA